MNASVQGCKEYSQGSAAQQLAPVNFSFSRFAPSDENLAALGFLVCFVGLVALCVWQGMSWWLALMFFAGYFLIAVGITRIRAQLGSPVHDLHFAGPDRMLLFVSGSQNLSKRDLCFLTLFGGFNRAYRGHPMPHMLEGMWMAKKLRDEGRGTRGEDTTTVTLVAKAIKWGWVLGYAFGVWALLRASFQFGGRPWYGMEVFRQLDTYLHAPTSFGLASLVAILWGGAQTALLALLHNRFNFPLAPCRLRCFGKLEHELVLGIVVCGVAFESVTHPLGRVGIALASNAFLHGLSHRRTI